LLGGVRLIEKLKAFIEIAKVKNLTKASENLYTSQSTISMKIKSLEDEIGTKLFDRRNKTMYLNEYGEAFYLYAESICNLYDEALKTINNINNLQRGILSISSGFSFGTYLLPNLLAEFKNNYPNINANVKLGLSEDTIQDVIRNKFELGFIGELNVENYKELISKTLCSDKLVLVCSPKHKWIQAKVEEIHLGDLSNETFILNDKYSASRKFIEKILAQKGIFLKNTMILPNIEAIKKAVENNLGVAIISEIAVRRELTYGFLASVPIKNLLIHRDHYYIYRKDKTLSKASLAFLNLCLSSFEQIQLVEPRFINSK